MTLAALRLQLMKSRAYCGSIAGHGMVIAILASFESLFGAFQASWAVTRQRPPSTYWNHPPSLAGLQCCKLIKQEASARQNVYISRLDSHVFPPSRSISSKQHISIMLSLTILAAIAAVSASPIQLEPRQAALSLKHVSNVKSVSDLVAKGQQRLQQINSNGTSSKFNVDASSGSVTNEDVTYVAPVTIGGNTWSLIVDTGCKLALMYLVTSIDMHSFEHMVWCSASL